MKMIVGLGNPGDEYKNTRHNIGFMVIDDYVRKNDINDFHEKFNGLATKMNKDGEVVILLKPLSYMNLSGTVIRKYADYFKIKPEDILVIHDDLDMPIGKIKVKFKGSSGGHNGIKNIIENLHTEIFPRFKVGIMTQNEKRSNIEEKNYVLGKFSDNELKIFDEILNFSNNIIDDFINSDIEKVMSKYNGAEYEIK